MPISTADLKVKYSTKVGAAGNANAGTAAGSLGKYISTTEVVTTLHGLFDEVTGEENLASEAEYRCIFLHNAHATISYEAAGVYILSEVAGGAGITIGVDPTAISAIGAAGAQAVEIANENAAPVGVVFTAPTTSGTALNLGTIGPGQCKAIWICRTATNSSAQSADGATLRFRGESV